jgi:hypothetical protein
MTLTIDDDVAAMIEQARRERAASLKDLANKALRAAAWKQVLPGLSVKRYGSLSHPSAMPSCLANFSQSPAYTAI